MTYFVIFFPLFDFATSITLGAYRLLAHCGTWFLLRSFLPGEACQAVSAKKLSYVFLSFWGASRQYAPRVILVAKSKTPSQAACSMTRLKAEVRVCSGASPRSQLIN